LTGLLDLGFRYTLQRILERDDFAKRLKEERPIALAESFYPLLQGYDSVAVKSDVEIGGTDQKFNLLVGRELQRDFGLSRRCDDAPAPRGPGRREKMSKSYGNHVALNDPPKEMFGKIMSVGDSLMWQYFELLTDESAAAMKELHPKEAKMKLASHLTARYHGESAALDARKQFEAVFAKGKMPTISRNIRLQEAPLFVPPPPGVGLSPSKNESRRLIEGGGSRSTGNRSKTTGKIEISEPIILQVGKRKFKKSRFPNEKALLAASLLLGASLRVEAASTETLGSHRTSASFIPRRHEDRRGPAVLRLGSVRPRAPRSRSTFDRLGLSHGRVLRHDPFEPGDFKSQLPPF